MHNTSDKNLPGALISDGVPSSLIHIGFISPEGGGGQLQWNAPVLSLFFFFFTPSSWMASKLFFPRAPWKTNGLPLESIWRVCVVEIKKRPHDLCAIWFPVQLREEHKQKKWLMLEQCIVRWRFDKQAFSLSLANERNVSSFSKKFSRLSLLCLSLCARFCFTHRLWSSFFEGQRASLYLSACLFSYFSPFVILLYSKFGAWPLSPFSHEKVWMTKMNFSFHFSRLWVVSGRVAHAVSENLSAVTTYIISIVTPFRRLSVFCWQWHW